MVTTSDRRPESLDNEVAMPTWLFWLQLGLSTTLAVLFVVTLVKTRQQSISIRELQDKVAGIENGRALDRTTAIEDQLRTTAERLQALERVSAQVSTLSAENNRLRQDLQELDRASGRSAGLPPLNDGLTPPPPVKP